MVELAAPDPETDRPVVARFEIGIASNHTCFESEDGLKRAALTVVADIEVQVFENLRCDPTGAHLIPRKRGSIHHHDVEAVKTEPARARRSRRSAAHDDHVT